MFQVQVKFKLCLHWRNLLRGRGQISQLKHIYIGKVFFAAKNVTATVAMTNFSNETWSEF